MAECLLVSFVERAHWEGRHDQIAIICAAIARLQAADGAAMAFNDLAADGLEDVVKH